MKIKTKLTKLRTALLSLTVLMVLALATLLISGLSVLAWGPERQIFTGESPADFVTFNSIGNNPVIGDERNFVQIREAGVGTYSDEIKLEVGKEYEIYTFYHNNAKERLNLEQDGIGIAINTRLKAQVPSVVKPGERGVISSMITADNATPKSVWDEAYITTDSSILLRYVPGSAIIHSNGAVNGRVLPSSLFSDDGTYIGYSDLNGILPGCTQYSGWVTYRIKVDQPNFEAEKEISKDGTNNWQKSVTAVEGETIDFKVTYKNTGTIDQNNVVIKDILPKGLIYVDGSSRLVNISNPNGLKISDGIVSSGGVNIGNYGPGVMATVSYKAKIAAASELMCGKNELKNKVVISTDNGAKNAEASVEVTIECKSGECKPGVVEGDPECNSRPDEPSIPGDPNTPSEFPVTGPLEISLALAAVLGITLSIVYWHRSREAYKKTIKVVEGEGSSDGGIEVNHEPGRPKKLHEHIKHHAKTLKSKLTRKNKTDRP
jgi:uncharacterized repeat protein (TIGR01451 family)